MRPTFQTTRLSVVVAVVDSGLDYDHPDIAANVWVNPGEDLDATMANVVKPHPGRLITCTVPSYDRLGEADYPSWQADELGRAEGGGSHRADG